MRRITVFAPHALESEICQKFMDLGASGYTLTECRGRGKTGLSGQAVDGHPQYRIETIVTRPIAEPILDFLKEKADGPHRVTTCVEDVDVLKPGAF